MNLSAFLYPFVLAGTFIFVMSLTSARISVVLALNDDVFEYKIKGSILKHITVFAIKSGVDKEGRQFGKKSKGKKNREDKFLNILKNALKGRKLRLIHVERLVLEGTYSIGDAAANAILFGLFMALWQFLLLYLNEHFKLEHQSFRLKPDFQNDRNNFTFHIILRAAVFKIVWLLLLHFLKEHRHKEKNLANLNIFTLKS